MYTDDKQRELDEFKKKLRLPLAMGKSLPWDIEVPRVVVTLHDKHDPKNNLTISDCTAHKFSFLPKDLGIVELDFIIKTKDMTEDQVMHLLRANGQELQISLICAPAEEKPDNFQQADLLAQEPMSEAREKAEAAFTAGAAPAGDDVVGQPTLETSAPPDDVVDATFDPTQQEKQPEEAAIIPLKTRARRGSGKAVVVPE